MVKPFYIALDILSQSLQLFAAVFILDAIVRGDLAMFSSGFIIVVSVFLVGLHFAKRSVAREFYAFEGKLGLSSGLSSAWWVKALVSVVFAGFVGTYMYGWVETQSGYQIALFLTLVMLGGSTSVLMESTFKRVVARRKGESAAANASWLENAHHVPLMALGLLISFSFFNFIPLVFVVVPVLGAVAWLLRERFSDIREFVRTGI